MPATQFEIAKDFSFPLDYVTQAVAIVAQRGAGKTYAANVIAEECCRCKVPFVAFDPMGVFTGLTSAASGDKPGFAVAIVGGPMGHIPLRAKDGKGLANWVVQERVPVVFDMSELRHKEQIQFMTEFCAELYHKNREPLHLIVDEADLFAPQKVTKELQKLLNIFEDLVRRGRVRGLGMLMITQRPAVINKNILTQASALIMLRLGSPQDRAAISDWIRFNGEPDKAAKVLESVASLPIGTAWIWSPGWLQKLQRVRIRQRYTFDSSYTPKVGEERKRPKVRAKVNLRNVEQYLVGSAKAVVTEIPKLDEKTANALEDLHQQCIREGIGKAIALEYIDSLIEWFRGSEEEPEESDSEDEDDDEDDDMGDDEGEDDEDGEDDDSDDEEE